MKKSLILLLLLFLHSVSLLAADQKYRIPLRISYFLDKDGTSTPADVLSNEFIPSSNVLTVKHSVETLWVRIDFNSKDNKWFSYTLDLGQESVPSAELYIKRGNKWNFYGQTGRHIKYKYQKTGNMRQTIYLNVKDLEPGENHTLLLKIKPEFGNTIKFFIRPTGYYLQTMISITIVHSTISCLCVSFAFMALIYGLLFSNRIMVHISINAFIFSPLQLQQTGVGPTFIWNALSTAIPSNDYIYYFFVRILIISTAWLFVSLAEYVKIPKYKKSFTICSIVITAFSVLDFLANVLFFSRKEAFYAFNIITTVSYITFIVLTISLSSFKNGEIPYNVLCWIPAFAITISRHIPGVFFTLAGTRGNSLLLRDNYILNYIAFLLFIWPMMHTTIKRIRTKFKKLYSRLSEYEQKEVIAAGDRKFYTDAIQQLLEMNTIAINAVNMPELKFDNAGSKEIKNLIHFNLNKSKAFLNTALSLKASEASKEVNINLKEFFTNCVSHIKTIAGRKKIEIFMQSSVSDADYIRMNPYVLELVFANLFLTMIKLTEHNTNIRIFLKHEDDTLVYEIHNDVSSKAQSDLKRMFGRYNSSDTSVEKDSNVVFDLEIVEKICKMYDGKFYVSFPSKSICFTAELQIKSIKSIGESDIIYSESFISANYENKDSIPVPAIPTMPYFDGVPLTVFIAESNMTNTIYLKNILQDCCNIYTAENGMESWNRLTALPVHPDIIIAEYSLPLISGLELFKKCSSSPVLQNIPFIMIIQSSEYDSMQELYAGGISACLVKPFTSADFFNTIMSVVSTTYKAKNSVLHQLNRVIIHNQNTQAEASDLQAISQRHVHTDMLDKYSLSAREKQIVLLISVGKSDKEIADELKISPATVATHNKNIFKKLSVHSRIELIKKVQ